ATVGLPSRVADWSYCWAPSCTPPTVTLSPLGPVISTGSVTTSRSRTTAAACPAGDAAVPAAFVGACPADPFACPVEVIIDDTPPADEAWADRVPAGPPCPTLM